MALIARAMMSVASAPGTGTVTLGSAMPTMRTWAAAGAANGGTYSYLIEEGSNWEIGTGTYNSTGPTLARTTLIASSTGAAVSFGAAAVVSQVPLPGDIPVQGLTGSASLGGSTGYATFSTGMILQWGISQIQDTYLTFPTAFPNACRAFVGTVQAYDGTNLFSVNCDAPTKPSIGVHVRYLNTGGGGTTSQLVHWWAIGL